MRKIHFLSTIIVAGLLLALVNAAVTINEDPNINDPICSRQSEENVADQSSTSSSTISYIAASSFFDSTNNAYTEIMVKSGDQSNPFKFLYFDDDSVRQEVTCANTQGFQFVGLINNFLFLKQTSSPEKYHACRFDPATAVNSVNGFTIKQITLPVGATPPMKKFIPYSVRQTTSGTQWTINILYDASNPKVYINKYSWSTIDSSGTPLTTSFDTGLGSTSGGVEDVIYSDLDGFEILGGTTYTEDTSKIADPAAGSTVSFYRTLTRTSLIGVYQTATSASFYLVRYTTQLDFTAFTDITGSSTDPFRDYFDDSANIMIISTTQVAWINVAADDTMLKVIATTTQIPTENLQSVSFSGKTAVFFYTKKLVKYQVTGDNSLQKKFSYTTSNDINPQGSADSRTLTLSCFCRKLKRFSCYSSTLNCLLLKKGSDICPAPQSFTGL